MPRVSASRTQKTYVRDVSGHGTLARYSACTARVKHQVPPGPCSKHATVGKQEHRSTATGTTMTQTTLPTTVHGGCHCGGVHIEFTTHAAPAGTTPRACDCSFCRKHGAAYVSDPAGRLRITATTPGVLHAYHQGSNTARFQLCGRCGVLVAVLFEHDGQTYGAVNAGCLDEPALFGAPVAASPQRLSPEEKVTRWLRVWVPDVQVVDTTG